MLRNVSAQAGSSVGTHSASSQMASGAHVLIVASATGSARAEMRSSGASGWAARASPQELFGRLPPGWVVSSAGCGGDLLAQETAGALPLHRKVVLPFGRAEFRQRSVVDRPGEWGPRFERLMDALEPQGNVLILDLPV